MSAPDEVFVNPRQPDDVEFGHSIVVPLTGLSDSGVTGSYIKTDRTGEMTHYIPDTKLNPLPLRNYKCFGARFMKENRNINLIIPEVVAYNTDDTFSIDINNFESYGSKLFEIETLFNSIQANPPSATLAFMQYCEFQIDISGHITFIELSVECSNANIMAQVAHGSGTNWTTIPAGVEVHEDLDIDNANTTRIRYDLDPGIDVLEHMRFRIQNADFVFQLQAAVKIKHITIAGEKL